MAKMRFRINEKNFGDYTPKQLKEIISGGDFMNNVISNDVDIVTYETEEAIFMIDFMNASNKDFLAYQEYAWEVYDARSCVETVCDCEWN